MQATDTLAIDRLIGKARFRMRSQWALEGATTASILASGGALVSVFAMRIELVSRSTGIGMVIASGALIVLGAIISAVRKIDDEAIARRIDRASGLSDRLSTAIAFSRSMGSGAAAADETEDMMIAAIKDGVRAVPRANVKSAAPFVMPTDLKAAFGFMIVSALAAGLMLPQPDRTPGLLRADPDHARPGELVYLRGNNLLIGIASPVAATPTKGDPLASLGAPGAVSAEAERGFVPADASVYLGPSDKARPVLVLDWTKTSIKIRVPDDAPIGDTILTAYIGKQTIGPVNFTVVDLKDTRYHNPNAVILDADERAYVEAILNQLEMVAKRDNVPELEEFAKKIKELLKDAEDGKLTKEQLLDMLTKAEEALNQHAEPNQAEIEKAMSEMGKELSKEKITKELGEALQKNDLEKAKEELEKLASKLDPKEAEKQLAELNKQLEAKDMTDQEKKNLEKQLDDLNKKMEELQNQKDQENKIEELEKQLEQLHKQLENPNLSEKQKQDLEKKIEELEKQLEQLHKQLEKNEQQKQDLQHKMEELKKQMDHKQLSEQDKQELQKKMEELQNQKQMTEQEKEKLQQKLEQVAKQMQQKDQQQDQKQEQQQQKLKDEIKRLEKKQQEAKNQQEKLDAERQLQKKKDELQKLQKDQDDKDQSAQREALKRLQKDMEQAAENLEKPQKDPNKSKQEQDEEQKERDKQASRNLKDAARETSRVDKDQRKQAAQKKMASQMDDLREAMRRAKQKGNKGPNDPFGKQGKNKDFNARARGQKGSGQAWKPGQGQQGQGQGQKPGGNGNGQGGDSWGTGTDPNLTAGATGMSGNTKDEDLTGENGGKGSSRRETILAAAQKGFASTSYKKVYADYEKIVEEVMRNEKLPSSYKYYVKRYFAKIHPNTGNAETAPTAPQATP